MAAILVLDRAITESSTQKIGYAELVPDDYDPEAGNRAYAFGWYVLFSSYPLSLSLHLLTMATQGLHA